MVRPAVDLDPAAARGARSRGRGRRRRRTAVCARNARQVCRAAPRRPAPRRNGHAGSGARPSAPPCMNTTTTLARAGRRGDQAVHGRRGVADRRRPGVGREPQQRDAARADRQVADLARAGPCRPRRRARSALTVWPMPVAPKSQAWLLARLTASTPARRQGPPRVAAGAWKAKQDRRRGAGTSSRRRSRSVPSRLTAVQVGPAQRRPDAREHPERRGRAGIP